jgi:hypothetical protein
MVLHVWMVIFGDSDITLRLLSVLFSVLTLPVSYLIGRELYGTRGGLVTICFFSVNSGLIHFSQEVRFYSALVLFCTLSALFLIRIRNTPSIQNSIGLIVSNVLIVYITTIGSVFVFIQSTLFLLYLIYTGRSRKQFLKSCLGIFILCIPALPLLVYLTIKRSKLLFSYFDWYFFDFTSLWTFIINVGGPFPPRLGIENSMIMVCLVLLSTAIFFLFIIKSITQKKIVLTLFLIGFIPFLVEVIFSMLDKFAFSYWHSIFTVPFLIISASCGLFQFKNRYVPTVLMVIYLTINLSYLFFSSNSVLYLQKPDGYNLVAKELAVLNASNQDVMIMAPFGGNTAIKYDYKARIPPFSLDDYLFFNGEVFDNILEPDVVKSLNRNNVYSQLSNFANSEFPTARFKNFIQQQSTSVPQNRYFFVVVQRYLGTSNVYNEKHMIDFLRAKILDNILFILNQDTGFTLDSETSYGAWVFFRFKRIN